MEVDQGPSPQLLIIKTYDLFPTQCCLSGEARDIKTHLLSQGNWDQILPLGETQSWSMPEGRHGCVEKGGDTAERQKVHGQELAGRIWSRFTFIYMCWMLTMLC